MMNEIQRYAMRYGQMLKSEHGVWVRHDQHAAEVARLKAKVSRLSDEVDFLHGLNAGADI
jgi:hypothetical protein